MKKRCAMKIMLFALAVSAMVSASQPAAAQSRTTSPLQLEEQIFVPDVSGRIDHFSADPKRRLLIVSELGNNSVGIIDVFAGKVIHTITGLNEPQGSLYVPGFDEIMVAQAGDGKVNIYDAGTYALKKALDFKEDADNMRWDEASKKVFVGYGGDETGAIGIIDPASNEHVGDFKIGFHPESFQLEQSGNRIFVNVPDAGNVVEVIDRKTGSITKWPLNGLRANYAMALDDADRRLFTITRKEPMLVVLDTESGKEIARLPAAGECDDAYFDTSRKRIYVIGAEGFISVFDEKAPDHYALVQNVPTAVGARTGYWYAKRDRMYVGISNTGVHPAQIWTFEAED